MNTCAPHPVPAADAPIERERLLAQALEEGLRHHRAGDLAAAADIYGCILAADPQHPQAATGIEIHRFPALDMYNDFDETAALMSALDLVITAPTTVCALSAALGVPTWQLASGGADWQPLGEDRVPWLPSVRRVYRPWHENWSDVLRSVAAELSAWSDSRNTARSLGLSAFPTDDEVLT